MIAVSVGAAFSPIMLCIYTCSCPVLMYMCTSVGGV